MALFPVSAEQRAVGRVEVLEHGATVVPAYGQLSVEIGERTSESPIGAGGEFYLEGLEPGTHPATIEYGQASCTFTLVVPAEAATVLHLGLVRCLAN